MSNSRLAHHCKNTVGTCMAFAGMTECASVAAGHRLRKVFLFLHDRCLRPILAAPTMQRGPPLFTSPQLLPPIQRFAQCLFRSLPPGFRGRVSERRTRYCSGLHWRRLPVDSTEPNFLGKVNSVVALDSKVIFAGTSNGIYKSFDGGCSFTNVFLPSSQKSAPSLKLGASTNAEEVARGHK
jgi:hypothetical protein